MKSEQFKHVEYFDDDSYSARKEKNFKKKAPKHRKMDPMKKQKYKDRY